MGRLRAIVAIACVAVVSAALLPPVRSQQVSEVPSRERRGGLASGELREAKRDRDARTPLNSTSGGSAAKVEVLHALPDEEARELVRSHGGVITGDVPGHIVQARMPWDRLEALEAEPGVIHIRPPQRVNLAPNAVVGQEIAKTDVKRWHRRGHKGKGVKVGIIDYFSQGVYDAARAAGEVPKAAGGFCIDIGTPCDVMTVFGPGQEHGTAVMEVIHEMAPKAKIYIASAYSASDLMAAVRWFARKGVRIISRSISTPYDGPGDGTGPVDAVVDLAAAKNITWFNSAGNSGSGAYYRGTFTDADANGYHEFAPGVEFLEVPCPFYSLGLRWDDWGEVNPTDFDLWAYVKASDGLLYAYANSLDDQTAGFPPVENFAGDGLGCHSASIDGLAYIAVRRFSAGASATDTLEFQNNGLPMSHSVSASSAAVPVCDSANPAQVCVGAIDPAIGTTIAAYSSRGPTNDSRVKPDISAAACVDSFTYGWLPCFNGTSAATPAAAGAAAVVLSAKRHLGAARLGNYMRKKTTDRGVLGPDPIYGTGEFIFGKPPRRR